jgi:hypothetical protein
MVHVPKIMMQQRVHQQQVEQVVEVPVPMTQEEVVHVPTVITQQRAQHQHVEMEVQVPVPMTQEEVVHVPVVIPQERISHQHVEQVVEVHVPMTQEHVVHVPTVIQHERQHHFHVEEFVDIPVEQKVEQIVHVPVVQHVERIVHNPVEMIVEVPRPVIIERAVEVPKIQIEEKTIYVPKVNNTVVNTVVQHQIQKIEVVKPTIVHKVVQRKKPIIQEHIQEVPKVMVQHVPVQRVVEELVKVPRIQYVDEVVHVPVQELRHVPMIQKVQKTIEVPQVQYEDVGQQVPINEPGQSNAEERQHHHVMKRQQAVRDLNNRLKSAPKPLYAPEPQECHRVIVEGVETECLGQPEHNTQGRQQSQHNLWPKLPAFPLQDKPGEGQHVDPVVKLTPLMPKPAKVKPAGQCHGKCGFMNCFIGCLLKTNHKAQCDCCLHAASSDSFLQNWPRWRSVPLNIFAIACAVPSECLITKEIREVLWCIVPLNEVTISESLNLENRQPRDTICQTFEMDQRKKCRGCKAWLTAQKRAKSVKHHPYSM